MDFYRCLSCGFSDDYCLGVCEVCAKKCHKGHELQFIGYVESYCDCGAGGYCTCHALPKKKKSQK